MITGYDLIESQKLYSTGDENLDDLLERAFCEGYEYAQKEFGGRQEYEGLTKKGKEDLANLRGMIASGLMESRKNANKPVRLVNKVGGGIAKNIKKDAKKVGIVFPEYRDKLKKITSKVDETVDKARDTALDLRNKDYDKSLKLSGKAASAARKYALGKDKTRKRLRALASVL